MPCSDAPRAIDDKEDGLMRKLVLLGAAVGALATSLTAVSAPRARASAHGCTPHNVGFVASGVLGIWSLTLIPAAAPIAER
jgi:hypothetical protein